MNWTAGQQAMLEAMGLQVLTRAPAAAPHEPVPAPTAVVELPAAVDNIDRDSGKHPGLARALLRASGGREIAGLVDDLARLSREPALKRALWPRLRALRRSH